MFGSVFRMKPVAGKKNDIVELFMESERTRAGGGAMRGYRAGYLLEDASGDLYGFAIFNDEQAYRANAEDPEQDKWYRRLREMLQADPEWHDGAVHSTSE